MAALTADKEVTQSLAGLYAFPVAASTTIYKGAMVCLNSSGYLVPAADTAGYVFVGIAYERVDNSAGSAGDRWCRVLGEGVFPVVTAGASQAWLGQAAYITDDQTVNVTGGTNKVLCGYVARYDSATAIYIRICPFWSKGEILEFPAGSVSAPGLPVMGDSDTGWYSPGADQLAPAVGGVNAFTMSETAGDITVTWGSTTSFTNSAPTLFAGPVSVFGAKAVGNVTLLTANEHPPCRVRKASVILLEVPDASGKTITAKLHDGTADVTNTITFTQGVDAAMKMVDFTVDTDHDNVGVADELTLVIGGTTVTAGKVLVFADLVGE